ncbi:MAG: hypothetical protein M3R47_12650 [Chloroflexota bacterium]|nr:hypothetical protein [Chloroflexota bacterium]
MGIALPKMPMKIRQIITVSLVATLLASCVPAAKLLATATVVPAPTMTPVPASTPIPIIPTKQLIEPELDDEIQIKFGESITLEKGKLRIKFKSLAGDSRCPQGVVCVWAGNAEVILEVSKIEIALNTALDPNEKVVGDYNIQLRDVIPYPKAGEELKPEDYSIKIVVSKK